MKLINCPVCKKRLWEKIALKNHIINSAKGEGFIHLNNILNAAKAKPYSFSPMVLLRQTPHLSYYRRHLKNKIKKELVI